MRLGAREDLQHVGFWAAELTEGEAQRAAAGLSIRRYTPGSYICHQGDRLDFWTGVVSGLVKLCLISPDGQPTTFSGVPPGGWFGEGTVLKNEPRRYDCVAIRETEMALLHRTTFNWLYEHSVGFNRFLVKQLNERMGQFIATIECDRMHDPVARVARNLAWLFNPVLYPKAGNSIEISQEEISLLVGVSRQIANRSLIQLEQEGLLALERGRIELLDLPRLVAYGG